MKQHETTNELGHQPDKPQYLKRRWGVLRRIAEMLSFAEHHPECMRMFGKTPRVLSQHKETLHRWIAAGRPDPEELLEDADRVEADNLCSWRDCMLMIQIHEFLTENNPEEREAISLANVQGDSRLPVARSMPGVKRPSMERDAGSR